MRLFVGFVMQGHIYKSRNTHTHTHTDTHTHTLTQNILHVLIRIRTATPCQLPPDNHPLGLLPPRTITP